MSLLLAALFTGALQNELPDNRADCVDFGN